MMSARKRTFRLLMGAASLVGTAALASACGPPPAPAPEPIFGALSLGAGDVFGNDATTGASISADGNLVAFNSAADNLVPGDTNGSVDTFVRDRPTGSVQRVVENTFGSPRMSANGRYVSYTATGSRHGVFDRVTGTAVTWRSQFLQSPAVVPDDGSVAIYGRPGSFGIFSPACLVRDLSTGTETDCPHAGPGFGSVALEAVSRNGRFVLYYWFDQDGGGTSARRVWDRQTGTFAPAPAELMVFGTSVVLSDTGRYLASTEYSPDFAPSPRVFDLQTGTVLALTGVQPDGTTMPIDISTDGRVVALYSEATNLSPEDTNGAVDIYLWNTATGAVTLASRRLDTGATVPGGAKACVSGPGQILASGAGVCVLTSDPLSADDTNAVTDAWLVPG